MAEKQADQEFVEYIVKALVQNSDKISTERKIDERGVLIELHCDPSDIGIVIGKRGQTIKAIRSLLRSLGVKRKAILNLKVIEPVGTSKTQTLKEQKESTLEEKTSDINLQP